MIKIEGCVFERDVPCQGQFQQTSNNIQLVQTFFRPQTFVVLNQKKTQSHGSTWSLGPRSLVVKILAIITITITVTFTTTITINSIIEQSSGLQMSI